MGSPREVIDTMIECRAGTLIQLKVKRLRAPASVGDSQESRPVQQNSMQERRIGLKGNRRPARSF
jgi:hypothetical protein